MNGADVSALKIVYMGSSDFAVPALDALRGAGANIAYVVTQPDRIRGRGGKVLPTPVGLYAERHALPLLKPESLKNDETFVRALTQAAPDLLVVAAYGKILPALLLGLPFLGCVNIHASLLPEYRGAAPVQRAILGGKPETGVTLMYMAEGLDTGDMIAAVSTETAGLTAGQLTDRLAVLGAKLLTDMLPAIAAGTAPRLPQDGARATYAEKIEKAEGHLDLAKTAGEAVLRVRAMTPVPGAYVFRGDERIVVTKAKALAGDERSLCEWEGGLSADIYEAASPGEVLSVSKHGICVRTGDGALVIEELKAPGRKNMPVAEYIKGNIFDAKTTLQ